MNLKEIGEFGFIERIKPMFDGLIQETQVGIGDDCAIISANDHEDWIITTDLLIEDVHFLRTSISPEQLGYKSLAVSLSDIAAMGGSPIASFLSIAIPTDIDVEYLDTFMKGYHKLSAKYSTPLLGGDTTKSLKHLAINVCVIGKCPKGQARKRSMARVGDAVCVTGFLGDSAGGLKILLNNLIPSKEHDYLLLKHYQPEPQLDQGIFLASNSSIHAMIDISDGIASDLKHILNASGVSAQIHLDWLPISEQFVSIANKHGWSVDELAIGGGEDYELLFTADKGKLESISKEFRVLFGKPIIQIGYIEKGAPLIRWFKGSKEVSLPQRGFNHFQ